MLPGIISLTAALIPRPWGGTLLKSLKGLPILPDERIGESWEVSLHPDGPSTCGGEKLPPSINFDYLVKFIEAKENLSVQTHPDDQFAARHENSWGKSECWLILSALPGAGIYLGFSEGVTKERFAAAIGRGEDLRSMLRFHPVSAGDFFYVPAGSVHAIGEGVTLIEVQQSSGITYRVWDWNRVDAKGNARELHIDKALQVLNFSPECQRDEFFCIKKNIFAVGSEVHLIDHPQFSVRFYSVVADQYYRPPQQLSRRAAAAICLQDAITMASKSEHLILHSFHSALCTTEDLQISGATGAQFLWIY